MELLDRPVWSSLTTAHVGLSAGDAWARRYDPRINVFGATRDDSDPALAALARLMEPEDRLVILQVPEIRIPAGLAVVETTMGVQMVAHEPISSGTDVQGVVALGEDDAGEMLELATLTRPGPFLRGTCRMGAFRGIRIDGRLAAMAGERFRFPGYTEVSGVCTHPDFRGRRLAQRLSRHVAAGIAARGETAFLHTWKSNTAAISLYESLGFTLRCEVNVAVLAREMAR